MTQVMESDLSATSSGGDPVDRVEEAARIDGSSISSVEHTNSLQRKPSTSPRLSPLVAASAIGP